MSLADLIKDYGPSVPWALAVAGLIYNNNTANHREKRKEFRSEIDAIEKVVKEINTKSTTYHRLTVKDATSTQLEAEIKILFKELDFKWARLAKRQSGGTLGLLIDPCADSLEALFDKATGDYFESASPTPPEEADKHIIEIYVLSLTFIECLHSLFLKKFDKI